MNQRTKVRRSKLVKRTLLATTIDKRKLVRHLSRVNTQVLNLSARRLSDAFIWEDSPQGHTFWYSMFINYADALRLYA